VERLFARQLAEYQAVTGISHADPGGNEKAKETVKDGAGGIEEVPAKRLKRQADE
jgi:hypothetical protein